MSSPKSLKTSNEHLHRSPSSASPKQQKVEESTSVHSNSNGEKAGLPWEYFPRKLDYTTVFSSNLNESKEFLSKAFGLKVTADTEHWMELTPPHANAHDAAIIGIHPIVEDKNVKSGDVHLVFIVKDIEKFHEHLMTFKNVEVLIKPTKEIWGSKAEYKGPTGIRFSIVMELPKEGAKGSGICWLDIPCEDMVRAKKFYTDAFGWTYKEWKDDYVLFDTNCKEHSIRGGLAKENNKANRINYPVIYFFAEDINAQLAKVKSFGGEILKNETAIGNGGYQGTFKDTEGNLMALYCHKGSM